MKAILMSIRPEWVAKILNGEKTIEIRKKFPKDYVGWVYIYCTKDKKIFLRDFRDKKKWAAYWKFVAMGNDPSNVGELPPILNGKVVGRFWCDKVEEIEPFYDDSDGWFTGYIAEETWNKELLKKSCLTEKELDNYLKRKYGYAIHITKLEIFDEPKELALHTHDNNAIFYTRKWDKKSKCWRIGALTRAPQSWCYEEEK